VNQDSTKEAVKKLLNAADRAAMKSNWNQVGKLVDQVIELAPSNESATKLKRFLENRGHEASQYDAEDLPADVGGESRSVIQSSPAKPFSDQIPSTASTSTQIEITWSSAFKIAIAQVAVGGILGLIFMLYAISQLD
jgi:hypothetical protein